MISSLLFVIIYKAGREIAWDQYLDQTWSKNDHNEVVNHFNKSVRDSYIDETKTSQRII